MVKSNVDDASDVPKISKTHLIIKWTEYIANFLHQTVGERNIRFSCVIRELDTVPGVAPPMVRCESYSEENGYMDKDLIIRASHTHPHLKEYNSKVYYYIEEAARTMIYAA